MNQARNPFVEALSAHDQTRLRDAFDRANEAVEQKLHRTTLTRWQDGSIPTSEEFIRLLADELDDASLVEAWQAAKGARSPSSHRAVVTRFDGLSEEDRERAYAEIRRSYLASRFPRLYDRLSYRVELSDPPEPEADHLLIRLTMEYDSSLPANAQVLLTTTNRELGEAYENPAYIYRDKLGFESDELLDLLEAYPVPILAYNHLGNAGQRMVTHEGRRTGSVFQFDNDYVENARVRLSFDYPFPRGVQMFPIRFGEFRVAGGAEFVLAVNAKSASRPSVFAYPPAGRQREWAANKVRPTELVVSLGAGGTILGDGDGLVLSWIEEK